MEKYEVQKNKGYWSIIKIQDEHPREIHITSCDTKTEATLLRDFYAADKDTVIPTLQKWYRYKWAKLVKKYGEKEAYNHMMAQASSMGFRPDHVNADASTGIPH